MHKLIFTLALLLAGCASYEWRQTDYRADAYRWLTVNPTEIRSRCGFTPPNGFNSGGACAIRLQGGLILATDTPLDGAARTDRAGRLCVIFASVTEEEAKRMRDWDGGKSLHRHELDHCDGWEH